MKINKFLAILCCSLSAAVLVSCHHSDDEDDTEYLSGTLKFDIPSYLAPGSVVETTPSGVTTSTGGSVGYYWYTSENTTKDTTRLEKDPASVLGTFTFEAPEDFNGNITVYCVAFAEGHYTKSQATTVVIVNDESLEVSGLSDEDPTFQDIRDGALYRYATVGGLDWMAQNLAYGSRPALGYEVLRNAFGAVYTWDEAVNACPEGWRLPSAEDWAALSTALEGNNGLHDTFRGIAGSLMVDATFNGVTLWEYFPAVKITGSSKLNLFPHGYGVLDDDDNAVFYGFGAYSVLWTSESANADQAYYRYIFEELPDVSLGLASKSLFLAPVRCVRDAE